MCVRSLVASEDLHGGVDVVWMCVCSVRREANCALISRLTTTLFSLNQVRETHQTATNCVLNDFEIEGCILHTNFLDLIMCTEVLGGFVYTEWCVCTLLYILVHVPSFCSSLVHLFTQTLIAEWVVPLHSLLYMYTIIRCNKYIHCSP